MSYFISDRARAGATGQNDDLQLFRGRAAEIRGHIPDFERSTLGLLQQGKDSTRLNEKFDVIIRRPIGDDLDFVPVGLVSKYYSLFPHRLVAEEALAAVKALGIAEKEIDAELELTRYGESMKLSLFMPACHDFDHGGQNATRLRLICWNSVDGSSRFRALMGWYRLVCSNGLIVGVTRLDLKLRHSGDARFPGIRRVLARGLDYSLRDRKQFEQWKRTAIRPERWTPWIEGPLKKKWGIKAAARANYIARSGHDAILPVPIRGPRATGLPLEQGKPVPGCYPPAQTAYDACQILAWLASERKDFNDQLTWQSQIPGLMHKLLE
ncbi:MAG: DUF932 domain-containing protein [Kiritimatiellia bacterium]